MRKTSFYVAVLHLITPISACSAENKSFIASFNFRETIQINQSNFQIFNNVFYSRFVEKYNVLVIS